MAYKLNDDCVICGSKVEKYLSLGQQPLANSYHKGESPLPLYPLEICLCKSCWHSQLSVSVSPDEMFEHYLYISDTSVTLKKYFEWTKEYILQKTNPSKVLELACNSGLFLEMFKNDGFECVGVDPAQNIRELSEQRGLDVYVDYWNSSFADKLKQERGKFDLILAFHVLPHVEDPNDFIASCSKVLSDNGNIFIQTSQCDMFLNNEFDVIYHEHSSYFTGRSILKLARNHDMYVSSIVKTDIHSKSFLFSLTKQKCDETELYVLIQQETDNGIYTVEKYEAFARKAAETKQKLIENLTRFRNEGYLLVGYGAAAKGNTLLNYMQFELDFIIDDNYLKWDYLTPGMNIPIRSIDLLRDPIDKICFVPLAWNFYKEIRERIKVIRDNPSDLFVRYFPKYNEEK